MIYDAAISCSVTVYFDATRLAPVSYWWKVPACIVLYIYARYLLGTGKSPSLEGQYST